MWRLHVSNKHYGGLAFSYYTEGACAVLPISISPFSSTKLIYDWIHRCLRHLQYRELINKAYFYYTIKSLLKAQMCCNNGFPYSVIRILISNGQCHVSMVDGAYLLLVAGGGVPWGATASINSINSTVLIKNSKQGRTRVKKIIDIFFSNKPKGGRDGDVGSTPNTRKLKGAVVPGAFYFASVKICGGFRSPAHSLWSTSYNRSLIMFSHIYSPHVTVGRTLNPRNPRRWRH